MKEITLSFIFILTLVSQFALGSELKYHGPNCLGEFCLNVNSWKEYPKRDKLIEKYGMGYTENGKFPFHCYVLSNGHYAKFSIYHGENKNTILWVEIKNKPLCKNHKKPLSIFKNFSTPEGLKIGDSLDTVIKLYGSATQKTESKLLYLPFENSNENLSSTIYLEEGKVSGIEIAAY